MKFLFIALISLSFANFGFAGETSTDCLMMKELNVRNNPKANLAAIKSKPKTKSSASVQ
jgi:hypothetical protein